MVLFGGVPSKNPNGVCRSDGSIYLGILQQEDDMLSVNASGENGLLEVFLKLLDPEVVCHIYANKRCTGHARGELRQRFPSAPLASTNHSVFADEVSAWSVGATPGFILEQAFAQKVVRKVVRQVVRKSNALSTRDSNPNVFCTFYTRHSKILVQRWSMRVNLVYVFGYI